MGMQALCAIAALLVASLARGAELHVPGEYPTIQSAVDAAVSGDTVVVGPGVYPDWETRYVYIGGTAPVDITALVFLKDGVSLSGAGAGVTVLDMSTMVVTDPTWGVVGGVMGAEITLEGFTITGAPSGTRGGLHVQESESGGIVLRDCEFRDLVTQPLTSAAVVLETPVTVVGCRFEHCSGGLIASQAATIVQDCEFVGNTRTALGVSSAPLLEIRNSYFADNVSLTSPGAIGIGLSIFPIIADCVFVNNTGESAGAISAHAATTLERNVFDGNRATNPTGAGAAAGLYGNRLIIRNNTFHRSTALSDFGGATLYAGSSLPFTLENNVFVENTGGPAVYSYVAPPQNVGCNVYWNNPQGNVVGFALDETDREVDPLFCDPDIGNLTLDALSPCLPENSLGCGLIGATEQGCGTVSITPSTWAGIKAAYR
jgi:hypothetical protein